jgi:hypothetical protein
MDVTIFYAWQTDRPEKVNLDLIRAAALAACERITKDKSNGWRVSLDSDTQGVAGMCDIPNIILKKMGVTGRPLHQNPEFPGCCALQSRRFG